jgi:hypothetical protein
MENEFEKNMKYRQFSFHASSCCCCDVVVCFFLVFLVCLFGMKLDIFLHLHVVPLEICCGLVGFAEGNITTTNNNSQFSQICESLSVARRREGEKIEIIEEISSVT